MEIRDQQQRRLSSLSTNVTNALSLLIYFTDCFNRTGGSACPLDHHVFLSGCHRREYAGSGRTVSVEKQWEGQYSSLTGPDLNISLNPLLSPSIEGAKGGVKRHVSLRAPLRGEFYPQQMVGTNLGDPESSIYHFYCAAVYFHSKPVFKKSARH